MSSNDTPEFNVDDGTIKAVADTLYNMIWNSRPFMRKISNAVADRIAESIDIDDIKFYLMGRIETSIDFASIVSDRADYFTNALIDNERFKTLLQRRIAAATNNLVDETVTRIASQLEALQHDKGDV